MIAPTDSQVRWQCRRGMLELDMMLHRFFDTHYHLLSENDKMLFSQLLCYPDHELYQVFLGTLEPTDPQLCDIISLIKKEKY